MARYWQDLTDELSILLRDDSKTSFAETLRLAAFNRACQYFSQTHTSLYKNATAAATAYGDGAIINLPDDFVELPAGGISAGTGRWLEPKVVVPGGRVPTNGYTQIGDGIYLYDSTISEVTLWYYANYDRITSAVSMLKTPSWAEWALLNLTMAYLLYPNMTGQASVRQFQPKRDAGSPEDSPPREQALFFMGIYRDIVSSVPAQNRSVLFRPSK